MHDNACKFNGPNGPDAQTSPIKSALTQEDGMEVRSDRGHLAHA
jgi:hypothetical protein